MSKVFIAVALISLGICTAVFGQQYTENKADQSLRSAGRVNPSTLGMEIEIPLGSYPGRGHNIPVVLNYSSKLWRMNYNSSTPGPPVSGGCRSVNQAKYSEHAASGWTTTLEVPYLEYVGRDNLFDDHGFPLGVDLCPDASPNYQNAYIRRLVVHLPGGETHELRADDTPVTYSPSSSCPPANGYSCDPNSAFLQENWNRTYYATDGTNLKYVEDATTNTYRLLLPDGAHYDFSSSLTTLDEATVRKATTLTERHGNTVTYNSQTGVTTDTLGRPFAAPFGTAAPPDPTVQTYQLPGLGGNTSITYKFHWKKLKDGTAAASGLTDFAQDLKYRGNKLHLTTNGNWEPIPEGTSSLFNSSIKGYVLADELFNPVVLTEIELPSGQSYKFSYDLYGRIDRIYYPTGGAERFVYSVIAPLGESEPNNVSDQTNFGVTNRKVYPTAGEESAFYPWNYSVEYVAPAGYKIRTTAPDGTLSARVLHRSNGACTGCAYGSFGYDNGLAGMPYEEVTFSGSGQPLTRQLTHWSKTTFGVNPNANADWHPRVDYRETITYDAAGNGVSATTKYQYEGDLSQRETPVLVNKTTQYGFVPLPAANLAGSLPEPGDDPDPHPTPVPTPVPAAAAIKISETTYLQNDTNYSPAVRDAYKAQNMTGLVTALVMRDGAQNIVSRSEIKYDEAAYPLINEGTATGWQDPNNLYRGNATSFRTWVKDTDTWIETHAQFDNFGHLRKQWDASGDATQFVQTDYAAGYNYAYPTKITAPAPDPGGVHGTTETSQITKTYDPTTGLTLSVTDANGQTASVEYDSLLRPKRSLPPPGGSITETEYGDTPGNLYVTTRSQIDEQKWAESTSYLDGLGRAYKKRVKDVQGDVFTEVEFDTKGRVKRVSNPYRAGETKFWSQPRYDDAGRVVENFAPAPDGQTGGSLGTVEFGVSTLPNYVGSYVVAKDASGRKARTITGIYGILRVDEATGMGGTTDSDLGTLANPNQPTFYSYNTKGEMTKITQGDPAQTEQPLQNRYFLYDSLGRLIRVKQPEQTPNANLATTGNAENNQWTASYSYDIFGNVVAMTDAKNTTITNSYDKASRPVTRTYSDGSTPAVDYYYDGKGLPQVPDFSRGAVTKVASAVSEDRFTAFDNHGRLLASSQVTDGQSYDFTYKYNLSGGLTEEKYPSGRFVRNFVDADGGLARVSSKAGNGSNKIIASGFDYAAAGNVRKMQLGNGLWETAQYNERLQLTQIGLGTTATTAGLWQEQYEYGELSSDGTTVDGAKNTGMMARQTTTIPTTGFVQTYRYDALNRLTEAKETTNGAQNWQQTFGYDRFGNRTQFYQKIGTAELATNNLTKPTIDQTMNRFTTGQGYVYDFNGNLIQDAEGRTFTFNGDDKQIQVKDTNNPQNPPIGTYFYDGSGARVKKVTNLETTIFVYDAGGALAAEYSTQQNSQPTTSYLTADHLGSPRVITDSNGQVISRRDFMPFGEEIGASVGSRSETLKYSYTGADNIRKRFTGYEKDDETQLDFAEARMYQNKHGRFTAVDPLLASASALNPQTFNRYSYTGNNPINNTDPSGLDYYRATDGSGRLKYFAGSGEVEGYEDVTGQDITITGGGCFSNGRCVGTDQIVHFNQNSFEVVGIALHNKLVDKEIEIIGGGAEGEVTTSGGVIGTEILRTVNSAAVTLGEDNGLDLLYNTPLMPNREYGNHTPAGQAAGHTIAALQGSYQIATGLPLAGLGALLSFPALVGGPMTEGATLTITAAGLLEAVHGGAVIGHTLYRTCLQLVD